LLLLFLILLDKAYKLNLSRILFLPFLFCCLISSSNISATTTPYFSSYSIKDGLPQSTVRKVFQDPHGLIWLLTQDGTARFDGKTFTPFKSTAADGLSLGIDYGLEITSDEQNTIWIGGSEGLSRYSYLTKKFTHITSQNHLEHGLPALYVGAILFDKSERLFVGTRKGLVVANDDALQKLVFTPFGPSEITSVNVVIEDSFGNLWVGTKKNGIYILDTKGKLIRKITTANSPLADSSIVIMKELPNNKMAIATFNGGLTILDNKNYAGKTFKYSESGNFTIQNARDRIWDMLYDSNGVFWVATWDGLMTFNLDSEEFNLIPRNTSQFGMSGKNIIALMEDDSGVLWIGTRSMGVLQYNTNNNWISLIDIEPSNESAGTSAIIEDVLAEKDFLWVGTNNGLYITNNSGSSRHILEGRGEKNRLLGSRVTAIYRDKSNILWVGTTNGISSSSDNALTFKHYSTKSVNKNSFSITMITEDSKGNLWIGTTRSGILILSKNRKVQSWINTQSPEKLISSNKTESLLTGKKGRVWVTHSNGISVFLSPTQKSKEFNQETTLGALKNNYVWALSESENNVFWASTPVGLHRIDDNNDSIKHFYQSIGNERREPVSILFDGNDDIWLTDIGMLYSINQSTNKVTRYDSSPLIKSLDFSSAQSRYKDKLYFGASNGLIEVDLSKLNKVNRQSQKLTIINSSIDLSFEKMTNLTMRYDEKFSISYSLTDYTSPLQSNYAYRLNNSKDWVDIGNQTTLVFSDLKPSTYNIQIKAKTYLNIPSKNIIQLTLKVLPPWWQSMAAYFIYLVVLCLSIYALIRHNANRARLRRELLEREVAQKTKQLESEKDLVEKQADEIKKINKEKTRLYETISHELRTPITLILGPIQQLRKKIADKELIATTTLIERNATRLNRLVNQLLDLSRTESVITEIAGQTNISDLAKNLVSSFKPYATDANINLTLVPCDKLLVDINIDDAEKLLSNLLSNAIKYSNPNDSVILAINKSEHFVTITVKDTGIGIKPDQIQNIFTRFYRVDSEQTETIEGSGIGLSIVKSIINKANGSIIVDSKLDKGTTFTVKLPISNKAPPIKQVEPILQTKSIDDKLASNLPRLLLIDDNEDILTYVSSVLANDYHITTASNGQEGIISAQNIIPDIIISDVMMPGIDGLELLETLKSGELTNHIPIVLLTAKGSDESKIKGLKLHADDYISKPFNEDELSLRLRNILDARDILKKKFSAEIMFESHSGIKKEKPVFIIKLDSIIEKHYQDSSFSVAELAKEAAVGERQLLRKLKATADVGAKEYIRSYRLKKAAELLHRGNTATLVAAEVGFSSAAYFSNCFKAVYSVTPSQYINTSNNMQPTDRI